MRAVTITAEEYSKGSSFVTDVLRDNQIAQEIINETMLIFEALFYNLELLNKDKNTHYTISARRSLGDVRISIGFEGKMTDPMDDEELEEKDSPENLILQGYADKIDHSYHAGYNIIKITVRRSYARAMMRCLIMGLVAVAVYIPISLFVDAGTQKLILSEVVFPLQQLFSNAILMIGAPVTFLSLIKNLTDVYILSERDTGVARLQRTTVATSGLIIILAIMMAYVMTEVVRDVHKLVDEDMALNLFETPGDLISSLMPPSIFEPFVATSPLPLVILAALFTYAFCSTGKYFNAMKNAVEAGYVLCSRVLGIIMTALPFFFFVAVEDMLLRRGFRSLADLAELIVVSIISLAVVALFYLIRLISGGVAVAPFAKKLGPLVVENIKIDSAIDAVAYNIRYCAKNYGINRRDLQRFLPVLAQINLDGNCFLLTFTSIMLILVSGTTISYLGIAAIAIIILFMSLGAPSQPGTFAIGSVIVFTFMQTYDLLTLAICMEVLLGGMVNIVNVVGDIVTVAVIERKKDGYEPSVRVYK